MYTKEDFIAVFDSGVGGISVLRELIRQMPRENYLYFGDSANAPYGNRPTGQVRELTLQAVEKMLPNGLKALVVACNTATSAAVRTLREIYPELIVVGIEPALKMAADRFPNGRVGVMATKVTLREEKFAYQAARFPDVQVERIPAPGLVELVEAGKVSGPEVESLLREILAPYIGRLDALVLGCTHYPFVRKTVKKILGPETALFDGGEGTARHTRHLLEEAGLRNGGQGSVIMENSSGSQALLELSYKLLHLQEEDL